MNSKLIAKNRELQNKKRKDDLTNHFYSHFGFYSTDANRDQRHDNGYKDVSAWPDRTINGKRW
jgi:hypothetical protein